MTPLESAPSGQQPGKAMVDAARLRALLTHARRIGTVEQWCAVALEYADAVESAVALLEQERERLTRNNEMLADALAATTAQLEEGGL